NNGAARIAKPAATATNLLPELMEFSYFERHLGICRNNILDQICSQFYERCLFGWLGALAT
ncbi:MAG: hypothetical protein ACLPWS_20115, partial [Rhodomicrobium sp.]